MKTRIQKWGNSLALRIPKTLASDLKLEQESEVEMTQEDGKIVVRLVPQRKYTLEALLAKVDEENLHREVETGPAIGNEIW